jgi:hypothetical protein
MRLGCCVGGQNQDDENAKQQKDAFGHSSPHYRMILYAVFMGEHMRIGWRQFVAILVLGLALIAAEWWDETHPFPVHVIRNDGVRPRS